MRPKRASKKEKKISEKEVKNFIKKQAEFKKNKRNNKISYVFNYLIFSFILIFIKKEFSEIKLLTKKYIKLLVFTNTIVIVSILLALTMYSTLWVVLTSLLSLLYLVFIYILSYFILKEIPNKKDIIITIFVASYIIIWVIFK